MCIRDRLIEEGMIENSAAMGAYFLGELKKIRSPLIKEVRGRGLMIGVELFPEAGGARVYCEKLMKVGVLCKETHDHIIRFAPPLIITREQIDWALERIEDALRGLVGSNIAYRLSKERRLFSLK